MRKPMILILFSLTLLVSISHQQFCQQPFQCNTDFVISNNSQQSCVTQMFSPYPPNAFNINPCVQGFSCYSVLLSAGNTFTNSSNNFTLFDGQCVLDQCQPAVAVGSFCYNNGDCESSYCNLVTNKCNVVPFNNTCLVGKNQCGNGLTCFTPNQGNTGTCQYIIPIGSKCSNTLRTNDSYLLCAQGTQCAYTGSATSQQGPNCVGAFSIAGNNYVELVVTSTVPHAADMLCSTYQIYTNNTCYAQSMTLNTTTVSNGRECSSNSDCGSSNTPTTGGICSCDYPNKAGQAYCVGFYGDAIYTQYFDAYYKQVQAFSNSDFLKGCSEFNCSLPNITMTLFAYAQNNIVIAGVSANNNLGQYGILNYGSGDTLVQGKCPVYNDNTAAQGISNFTMCRHYSPADNTVYLSNCLSDYICENFMVYPVTPEPSLDCIASSNQQPNKQLQNSFKNIVSKRMLAQIGPIYQNDLYCYRNGNLGLEPQDQTTGYPIGNFLDVGAQCLNTTNTAGNKWSTDCITTVCAKVNAQNQVGNCGVLNNGDNCTSSIQCDANSLCNLVQQNPTCQPILQIGSSCTNESFSLCPPNSQCILLYDSSQPYTFSCQLMFSVQGNKSFSMIVAQQNQGIIVMPQQLNQASPYLNAFGQQCQTGTFDINTSACKIDYEKTVLQAGQSFPPQCSSSGDCQSTYGNQGVCNCLPNTLGQGYCQGFFGDYEYNIIQFNLNKISVQNVNFTNKIYPYQFLLPNTTVQFVNNIFTLQNVDYNMPYKQLNFTNVPYENQGTCLNDILAYQFPLFFTPYSEEVIQNPQNLNQTIKILPFNISSFKPFPKASSNCTKYNCNDQIANKTTGMCMSINFNYPNSSNNITNQNNFENLEINVANCNDDYSCYSAFLAQGNDLFNTSNSTNAALGYYSYEGQCILNVNQGKRTASNSPSSSSSQFCYRDSDCITNFCNQSTCMWKQNQTSCQLGQSQCGPNMTCFLSKCFEILSVGATCSQNIDGSNFQLCPQGTVCTSFQKNSTFPVQTSCESLFSLPINSTNITIQGQSKIQVQYLCESGQLDTDSITCTYPDQTRNGFPSACTSDADCVGVNGTQGICNCDTPTVDGTAYCKGFPGDSPYQTAISNTQQALQNYYKNYAQCAEYMTLDAYTGSMKQKCSLLDLTNFTSLTYNGYISGGSIDKCLQSQEFTFPSLDGVIVQGYQPTQLKTQMCPAYQCSQSLKYDYVNNLTFCRYQNETNQNFTNQWFLANCPENYQCVPYNAQNVVGQQFEKVCVKNGPYPGKIIPYGGLCSLLNKLDISSLDCLTQVCLNQPTNYEGYGICGVLQENEVCSNDIQCGKAMKCFNNKSLSAPTCLPTLKIGSQCNVFNYKLCPHQSSCIMQQHYIYDNTTVYTCQPFYSQPNQANFSMIIDGSQGGQIVRQPVNDQNLNTKQYFDQMCQSGTFNSTQLQCNPYPEYSINVPPIQCENDNDCLGIFGTAGSCDCFPNSAGYKYCKLLPGDLQLYIQFFNNLVTYSQQNFSNCFPFEYMTEGPVNNLTWGGCYAENAMQYWQKLQQVYTPVDPQYVPSCFSQQFWNYGFKTFQFSSAERLTLALFIMILTFFVMFI